MSFLILNILYRDIHTKNRIYKKVMILYGSSFKWMVESTPQL